MRIFWLGCVLALGLAMAGCGSEQPGQQAAAGGGGTGGDGSASSGMDYAPAPEGVLRLGLGAEPQSLDPNMSSDIASFWVHGHILEPLVRLDANAQPQPAAAQSWEHNEDMSVWTFTLRDDARWHNGDPVTAHDFVYGIERILTKETNAPYAMMVFNFIKNGEEFYEKGPDAGVDLGAEAVDDKTLRITLSGPTPYFLTLANHSAWLPLHRETIEAHGGSWVEPGNYVGNGPFELAEYRAKDRIIVKKSDQYWGREEVQMDEIHFLIITDFTTELAAFKSGSADMITKINNREIDDWRGTEELKPNPIIGIAFTTFNNTQPPLDDPRLRRALALGVNRELLVERITKLGELPAEGIVPHGMVMPNGERYRDLVDDPLPVMSYGEQLQEAKRLLAEAGYAVDGGSGEPLPRLTYIYNTNDLNKEIAEALQSMWSQGLGIEVQLQNMEWVALLQRLRNQDFQLGRSTWIGDYMDPLTFLEIFETGHGKNAAGFSSERFDELLVMARQEADNDKRLEYFEEMEDILIGESMAVAPIYDYAGPYLIRPDVKNVVRTPMGGLDATRAYRE